MIQLNPTQVNQVAGGYMGFEVVLRPYDNYIVIDPFAYAGYQNAPATEFNGGSASTGFVGASTPWQSDPASKGLTGEP